MSFAALAAPQTHMYRYFGFHPEDFDLVSRETEQLCLQLILMSSQN